MNQLIEYTALQPQILDNEIDAAAQLAAKLQLGSLCVPPYWVKKASREVAGTRTQLTTVIGFPLGYQRTEAKIAEAELAFADGATAIELVMNLSAFKSQRTHWIKAEISRFAHLVHEKERLLTVVTDMRQLNESELGMFCKLSADAGADFVRTATGFAGKFDSPEQIVHLRNLLPDFIGIKVVTEVSPLEKMEVLIKSGASMVCVPSVK